ncbi:MAG TPA: prepilin-type N-terminal cleavage/methylation domain-containing protein [Gemmatimonadales bacterium]|nr:prepilin-type N-terminal cleavage/methylation domain-containing protein [Gemmatimonadales bacterium]
MSGRRAGVTLIELLVSLVISVIVAAALVRLIMGDMRSAEDREAWRTARLAARSGLTVLTSDLRIVETSGGLEAAAAGGRDLSVGVPYAFGALCATDGSTSTVSLLPTDSAMFAQPGHSGFAWRDDATGGYAYVGGGSHTTGAAATPCTGAGITVLSGGQVVTVTGAIPAARPPGTIVFLYRRIRYELKASTAMPGQTALWRTLLTSGRTEEIAAPFDAGARFRFYVGTGTTAQATVPSPLSGVSGLELAFDGRSDRTPRGSSGPRVVQFSSSVFFQNRTP